MKFVRKEHVLRDVKIVDLAEEFGIILESAASGNFDTCCRCPSKEHKNGNERTGSLYIDSVNNNFYCFGCGANSNVIDFYMLCADVDFSSAMKELRKRVDLSNVESGTITKRRSNFSIILDLSHFLRKTMLSHPEDLRWINKIMRRTDEHLSSLKSNEVEKAQALNKKVRMLVKERYRR